MTPPVTIGDIGRPIQYRVFGVVCDGHIVSVDVSRDHTRAVYTGPFGPVAVEYPHDN